MSWAWGHGPSGPPGRPAEGLPFAGIPSELQSTAQRLLDTEPDHPEPRIEFSYVPPPARPFGLRQLLSGHWWAIALGVVLVALETVTLQAGPLLTQRAIDRGVLRQDFSVVAAMAALAFGSVLVNGLTTWGRTSWTGRLGQRLMKELRVRVFSHIQRLSLEYFTEEKAGRIMTRMTSDIEALTELLQDGIVNLIVQAFTLVVVVSVIFALDAELALVVVLGVVPLMVVLTLWFRWASERTFARVRERIADVMADLQETLSGIRIVAAYNRQRFNVAKHRNVVGDHLAANERAAQVGAVYEPATQAIGALGQGLVLLVGGRMVLRGELTIGELTAFILYLAAFFAPIQQLVQLYSQYQQGQAAVAKLRDLLATRPSVAEAPTAVELPPIRGEIRLEGVTFGYQPDRPVLHGVDLSIEPGETFALVGPTGSGKSTIAKLVTRFYDPQAGRVIVDGHDLRTVRLRSLRRQLGVVPQEPFLFGGSVRDNVAFARPEASDEEVVAACQAVGLGDLIGRLPEGIHSPVFERGSSLSSGERQLLALARAFLAEPRVLILDEATSSLDLKSEATIERALDVVLEGRTAILIAHRLSTAMRANRIAVVSDGRIVELGSHDELVARGGVYAAMYATWTSHVTEAAPAR